MPSRLAAHLALFAVAVFYAGNYLIAKSVMNGAYIGPLGFVLLRVSTATLLFWFLAAALKGRRIDRTDWPRFILCGLTGVAANQSLFFSGLELTTPVHASLIMTTSPILVLVFSFMILHEQITPRKIGGIVIGCIGAVALVVFGEEVMASSDYVLGDVFVFLNATSYALYLVLVKRLIAKYPPLTVIRWVFTIGLVFVLPLGFRQVAVVDWGSFTVYTWLSIAYVIVFVTFLAYLLNIFALKRVTPAIVGFYIYLQPLMASVLSVMVGMEDLSLSKIGAGILIFTGVFLVSDFRLKGKDSQNTPFTPKKG